MLLYIRLYTNAYLMNYSGKASIYFNNELYDCFVELDPENSNIECKIAVSPNTLGFKPFKSIFSIDYEIKDLKWPYQMDNSNAQKLLI